MKLFSVNQDCSVNISMNDCQLTSLKGIPEIAKAHFFFLMDNQLTPANLSYLSKWTVRAF